uniref:Putative knottins n=1 Tax=Aedes albopictus TaxID=7160 RepID=A0A023ECH1_AEDAL
MKSTTVVCLALLCLAVALTSNVSAQSQDGSSELVDVEQFGVENDTLNLAKANLALPRNRCKNIGNCVHDRICNSTCKQWGYKDGECSGSSCICCS